MGKHKKDKHKHTSGEPAKKRHKKEHKKEKRKKEKYEEEKRLLKQAKKFLKQRLAGGGSRAGAEAVAKPDDTPLAADTTINTLTEDDYFAKNPEFTAWLREAHGRFFNELETDDARALFSQFAAAWNARKLPARYYAGMAGSTMRRTQHNWGIQLGAHERAACLGMAAALDDERAAAGAEQAEGRAVEAAAQKGWRAEQRLALDELLPKATGREARVEQKMARREAARERDASPDIVKLPGGGDVMGGGDSFMAARAAQQAREARKGDFRTKQQLAKREDLAQRATAAQAAEEDKMAMFRSLVARGPIAIPKRQ